MARSGNVTRRGFITSVMAFAGSVMGIAVGLPIIGYLISPALNGKKGDTWVPVGKLDNYQAGIPTLFSFTRSKVNGWEKTVNSYSVYVLRGSGDQVKVLSTVCTHLGCRVTYNKDSDVYACPCHDARFNREGAVISGPPPRPMDTYETKNDNGTLFIRVLES